MDTPTDTPAVDRNPAVSALDRIEAALARIEHAAPQCIRQGGDLRRRHDDLKASVARSLAGLDDLLGESA